MTDTTPPAFPQSRLREIAWDLGQRFPAPERFDQIHFAFVHPRLGFLWWHARAVSIAEARRALGERGPDARLVVRVYDVTDIIFDGRNAHHSFDLEIGGGSGNYYLRIDRLGRSLLAELGLRARDGAFRAIARSAAVHFDRERPARDFRAEGLYVAPDARLQFPVENIFDARIYERLNRARPVAGARLPRVAAVFLGWGEAAGPGSPFGEVVRRTEAALRRMGAHVESFTPSAGNEAPQDGEAVTDFVERQGEVVFARLRTVHEKTPFDLVHCHDWYSADVGRMAQAQLGLAFLLQLHSTEHERAHGRTEDGVSRMICEREQLAVLAADAVAVPHSATGTVVTEVYGGDAARVVIIEDPHVAPARKRTDPGEIKARFHLNPAHGMVLFCGEVSHAAGADLLLECLPHICSENGTIQFLFAGEGPLHRELEARANGAGLGHRVRFVGDVSQPVFAALLDAADFVVVPARTWQDEGVARAAIEAGKSVLTTHQAHLTCVQHGENGLVAYDNRGSITWGIKELIARGSGGVPRPGAHRPAGPSVETAAVELLMEYRSLATAARPPA